MSAEFPWESWFHREHADFCTVESRNYVLEKALREIQEWAVGTPGEAAEAIRSIVRKALGAG